MNLTDRGKEFFVISLLSLIFSYLIITLNYFPHLGFTLSLVLFSLLSYKFKKDKGKETKLYLTFTLLFSLLLSVRSEGAITFLNLVAALFFGSLILVSYDKDKKAVLDYIYAQLLFIIKSVFARNDYYLEFKEKKTSFNTVKATEIVFGILITIFLLVIILPLLSSTNPFFLRLIENVWNFLSLENLFKNIVLESVFIWSLRLVFFLIFIFIIPKIITLINKSNNYTLPSFFKIDALPLHIPKLVLAIILFVFFITQLQFYFASDEILKSMGISYSQHTREVFGQLSLVAGIVLVLIYNDKGKSTLGTILTYILGVQGIFLTLMAYKSVFEYINAWGLSYKRLYGLTFATWVTGIFFHFFRNYRQNKGVAMFVKKTIIFSGVILFLVNVLNFDYLIYHFQKAKTGQGVDYTFLSTLSPDSLSYHDQFLNLKEVTEKGDYSLEVYNNINPLIILYKIESLQRKYSKFDFRTVTFLDYLQYKQIKSVDTGKLRAYYENKFRFPNN